MGDTRRKPDSGSASTPKKGKKGQQEKKKGRPKSAGRHGPKYASYFSRQIEWEEKKLRRILKNNGLKEAAKWAKGHGPATTKLLEKVSRGIKTRTPKEECGQQAKTATSKKVVVRRRSTRSNTPEVDLSRFFTNLPCLRVPFSKLTIVVSPGINGLTSKEELPLGQIPIWLDGVSPKWRRRKPYRPKKAVRKTRKIRQQEIAISPRLKGTDALRAFAAG